MVGLNPDRAAFFEMEMLKTDTRFYVELAHLFSKEDLNTVVFGLMPYMALFVKESYDYSQKALPNFYQEAEFEYKRSIFSARLAAKLFDESMRDFAQIAREIDGIIDYHYTDMNKQNTGFYSWRRMFQKDLGLFLYDGHVYATSHIASFNTGLVTEFLARRGQGTSPETAIISKGIGFDIGRYVGLLQAHLPSLLETSAGEFFKYRFDKSLFATKDVLSSAFYPIIFNGENSQQINFYLLTFLVALNFLKLIRNNLIVDTPDTFLKIKYVALYHLITSVKNMQSTYHRGGALTERSKSLFTEIASNPNSKMLIEQSKSRFRNALVHYGIRETPIEKLEPTLRMYGLIEHFFGGRSFLDLDMLLDERITEILRLLEEHLYI